MKIRDIYEKAIKKARKEELRTKSAVENEMKKVRAEYRKLKGIDRSAFDTERLKHPYDDSRILFGSPNTEVRTIMVGIDIDVPEILMADRLREGYYRRWMLDPLRIDAQTKMPRFATDGATTKVTSILNGNAARQFNAIWQFLHVATDEPRGQRKSDGSGKRR